MRQQRGNSVVGVGIWVGAVGIRLCDVAVRLRSCRRRGGPRDHLQQNVYFKWFADNLCRQLLQ